VVSGACDKHLDAVSIVTPNHWHSLMAIWACQAGKDMYVEKPCSHSLLEGRRLVEAARKAEFHRLHPQPEARGPGR